MKTAMETIKPSHNILPRYLLVAVLARPTDEGVRIAFILLALERAAGVAFGGSSWRRSSSHM
ncbi:MAG: hypothetical protein M3300_05090 [Actinomycetota bacterium]|nr:hypothetical protein [Actinomycetota bacterium]